MDTDSGTSPTPNDAAVLEQHYAETGPLLLAYFGSQRPIASLAEDLLHETFIRALRDPSRLRKAVSPRAYLFGIARHVGLDALRRLRPAEPFEDEFTDAASPDSDPRFETMRHAIAALPDTHREPLMLKLQQGLSYEEIALVLGIPVGTVRSRLHYAIARLHQTVTSCD